MCAELETRVAELEAALRWAFAKVGRPTRRLAQNAQHYDRYFEVEALLKGSKP